MIRNKGYKLIHLSNTDYSSFTKTPLYQENQSIIFQNGDNFITKSWAVKSGYYTGIKIWKLDATITIPGSWLHDSENPLFVWGRSRQSHKSGMDKSYYYKDNNSQLTTYQSGYTQVTDGQNGNSFVDGIYHNQDLTVHVRTYQYEGYFNGIYKKIPPDDQIGANISVFGTMLLNSVNDNTYLKRYRTSISPNPVNDLLKIKLLSNDLDINSIQILDCLGNQVISLVENSIIISKYSTITINVSNFSSGVFFIRINTKNGIEVQKFIKGRY